MEAVDRGKAGGPEFHHAGDSCHSLPATYESVSAVKSSNRGGGECAVMAASGGWATTSEWSTFGAGGTGRAQANIGTTKSVNGGCDSRDVKSHGGCCRT